MSNDEKYMNRCLQLAKMGAGMVAPNPMVGAVLVYENKIISEGYHQKFGEAHAEVNCINNTDEKDKSLIEKSTLYVSLEPCAHHGKTPPCTNLIIKKKIKKVVVGCQDSYKEVDGKGIQKLRSAGIEVVTGILETECKELNKRFFTFHQKQRPFVILKWAQSADGKIGSAGNERILISNDYSNCLVHKWRSEEAAVLVGTNTVLKDNPSLTTRFWEGKNPLRIIIDKKLKVPSTWNIFNDAAKTIVFNSMKDSLQSNIQFIKIKTKDLLKEMLYSIYENNIQSILVEGGAKMLQSLIDADLWDEARVITNEKMIIGNGINAPKMKNFSSTNWENYFGDIIHYYKKTDKEQEK
ncbi:MAG: bifunctional diaminohydroxyphosphoribosylaminopyrimidine deaminase/5-amino-6-(5-phosphoribosylamino)uracil reductase RibD [Ginsengibacter sp.]